MIDKIAPRPLIPLVDSGPRPPRARGAIQARRDLLLGPDGRRVLLDRTVRQREARGLSGTEREAQRRRRAVDPGRLRGGEGEPLRPAAGRHPALDVPQQGRDEAELRPGRVAHLELDLAVHAHHPAEQGAGRVRAQVVAKLIGLEGERLRESGHAALGSDLRLEDHGALEVPAAVIGRARRCDRPGARVLVEQPGEHRRPVEPREAQPVDRACAAHERGRVAVGQEGVFGDGRIGHPLPPQCRSWERH